ncbi:unnamed protein product [Cochlearia groenlandica]
MQDSNTSSSSRKAWYQRAMAIARFATNWRSNPKSQPPEINIRPSRNPIRSNQNQQLRKCTSLKLAANSFTRVCLCAPIVGPYDDVFRNYVPPRRSSSYPPSNPLPIATETARMSVDSGERKVFFRGKSLKENELMRRFVAAEEEAMEKENRKRNEMEIVMKRNQIRKKKKKKLGPSRLSRMVIAEEEE